MSRFIRRLSKFYGTDTRQTKLRSHQLLVREARTDGWPKAEMFKEDLTGFQKPISRFVIAALLRNNVRLKESCFWFQ